MSMITSCAAGVAAGLVYGFPVGFLKYICLWKTILKSDRELTSGALYGRMGISWVVNVAALLVVFIFRNIMPVNFAAAMIGAAVGLSISGKLAPIGDIVSHVKEKDS